MVQFSILELSIYQDKIFKLLSNQYEAWPVQVNIIVVWTCFYLTFFNKAGSSIAYLNTV
jgi:hypothetical protein